MDRKNNSGGKGFNIFIAGIIFGVLATLLLTTKKGRKLLKVIIDEGTERVSKWEDVVDTLRAQVGERDEVDESVIGEEIGQIEETKGSRETKETDGVKEPGAAEGEEIDLEEEPLHAALAGESEQSMVGAKTQEKSEEKPVLKKKSRFFKGTHKKSA